MAKNSQIKWGAVISYATIAFSILSGFIYTPWMLKTIGKDQYALYTLAMSIINMFLLDFGIGASVSKFLARYYAEGKQEEANRFMGIVYKVYFIIAACIAVILFVLYFFLEGIYTGLTPSEMVVFKHLFIIVSVYSVLSFPCTTFNGVLMANERFIEVKIIGLLYKVFEIACIVVLLLLNFGVYAIVLVHALSSLVFHGVRYIIIRTKTKQRANLRQWSREQAKDLFSVSIWITVMNIASRCTLNIVPTILTALSNSTAVAFFGLASSVEGYVYTFANGINGMFLPRISRILTRSNAGDSLNSLMVKVAKFHVYTLGLILVEFACYGRQFVYLWLGDGYETVYWCALFLIMPCLIEMPQQVGKTTLLAMDVIKQQALIYITMAGINILVAVLLTPKLGAVGAGISIAVCYLFRVVAFNYLYHTKTPIQVGAYFKKTYLKWLPGAAVSIAVGLVISAQAPVMGIFRFLVSAAIVGVVYVIVVFALDVDKDTKKALFQKLKPRSETRA